MRRIPLIVLGLILAAGLAAAPRLLVSRPADGPDFVHFESSHVRPATLTPSGERLLVVNTPDARLSVFDLTGAAPERIAEIPVGLEPVSVAALDDSTAWVVNHLSDDVSVVDLGAMHVRATVRTGDEPADVVFAGTPLRAYVSVQTEDCVKVFDPATLARLATIPIAGRGPRALATNAARTLVYAAVLEGGNQTSVLSATDIPRAPADSMPEDFDLPRDPGLPLAPQVGLIVQRQAGNWFDMYGNLWNSKVKYSMAEVDVAEINTATHTVSRTFGNIGSSTFGLAVSPADGRLGVTSTDARNVLRFEPRLNGYLVETLVHWVSTGGALTRRIINPHIVYDVTPGPPSEADSALGTPTGIAFAPDGARAYVTALANAKLGVLNPAGAAATTVLARVPTVEGPTGVVVDGPRGRLYVVGRFRNQLQTLSASSLSSLDVRGIGFDPTPDPIVHGRRIFYDGRTSGHGDQSCATCHVFGDMDNLAWGLGDPNGAYVPPPVPNPLLLEGFDPMKGPMATQSLRGMTNTEPLHWRGDRVNLAAFNGAFVSLMGRASVLPDSQMAAFSDFAMALTYPPNPNQHLDRSVRDAPPGQPSAARGRDFYFNQPVAGPLTCNQCHTATAFGPGTNRLMVPDQALLEDQDMKVPQLRNLYRKTGFRDSAGAVNKRGFGYIHDGSVDNLVNFLRTPVFNFGTGPAADATRRDVEAFLHAFDTGMAPAVGRRITFASPTDAGSQSLATLDTLVARADAGDCDLVASGRVGGQPRGWQYLGGGNWRPDKAAEAQLTTADLRALAGPRGEVTFMGVPVGSGARMGHDRDRDGYPDGDELDARSDPGNPASTPLNVGVPTAGAERFALRAIGPNPFRGSTTVEFSLGRAGAVDLAVFDVMGRAVRTVARAQRFEAGPRRLTWDGRRDDGASAAAGVYFVRLRTEGGAWSRPVVRVW
jgi:YVTN family beta-propeller protein